MFVFTDYDWDLDRTVEYESPLKRKEILSSGNNSSHWNRNKNNSFVDKNLQIHGVHNIYICSTSVFPTSGSFNPTMTLCSLAIKLAKHLNK